MDVFQEDEAARASSMGSLVSALEKPEEFLIAAGILGYDLSEDTKKEIEELGADRKEAAAAIQENMKPKEPVEEKPEDETEDAAPEFGKAAEIHRLIKKAIKNIGKEWTFTSDLIPDLPDLLIRLRSCKNKEEINAVFEKPDYNPILEAMRLEMASVKAVAPAPVINVAAPAFNVTVNPSDPTPVIVTNEIKTEPIVNIPDTIVNVAAPIVNIQENTEAKEFVKSVRKLAKDSKA